MLQRYLFKWNTKSENPNVLDAMDRETHRQIWRKWYQAKPADNLGKVNTPIMPHPEPERLDLCDIVVNEPTDIEDFMKEMRIEFHASSSSFFEKLYTFCGVQDESLNELANRFDDVTDTSEDNNLMTSRNMALNLLVHVPAHLQRAIYGEMKKVDKARVLSDLAKINKQELLTMMAEEEAHLLET